MSGTMDVDGNGNMLTRRIEDLEQRISLFEELFHAFSSKLDQHFKKYDTVIQSQQQQINDLNSTISIMLNDQVRHSEILREKLSTTLHSISATSSIPDNHYYSTTDMQNPQSHMHHHQQQQDDGNVVVNAIFNDILSDKTDIATTNNSVLDELNSEIKKTSFAEQADNVRQNETFQSSIMNGLNNGTHEINAKRPLKIETNQHTPVAMENNSRSNSTADIYLNGPTFSNARFQDQNAEDSFEAKRRKYSNYLANFQFLKNPQTVLEVWKEYTEGINDQPSIKEMENLYQTSWRRDNATNKRYGRRKPLWKAIELGLTRGYELDYIIDLLESCRYTDDAKRSKHPIGWLCQSNNIPALLK
ncbi:hypothetical protein KAFR_0C01620 [Kazachstania africana CBS 2517]|uniref:Transcription activator GCR1-like domain-containing protein n=1 Tax=Kazachstania africana (strain ATCC 22294 / BCRC 22015 / CBS 2517 / CECT 1963 / NBRC 1671 / NRRL Y-8276) TaxID=1071382 RepID=H2AS05_KAZAF|nr:hypothetical protein KAFR_0C01620 [Kazachstania africana CBS 2517]CCF57155.1 hypothetical protein KAFR_0C01620 [Kazachstania africana CBS 2517]